MAHKYFHFSDLTPHIIIGRLKAFIVIASQERYLPIYLVHHSAVIIDIFGKTEISRMIDFIRV